MASPALVESDVEAGRKLLDTLDAASLPVSVALWVYSTESDEWRLLLALPGVETLGPRIFYARLRGIAGENPPISLDRISVVGESDSLIASIKSVFHVEDAVVRLSGTVVNGKLIEDAYVYRTVPPSAPRSATR